MIIPMKAPAPAPVQAPQQPDIISTEVVDSGGVTIRNPTITPIIPPLIAPFHRLLTTALPSNPPRKQYSMVCQETRASILEIQVNAALAGHDLGPFELMDTFDGSGNQT
jgi:hypothetical protein